MSKHLSTVCRTEAEWQLKVQLFELDPERVRGVRSNQRAYWNPQAFYFTFVFRCWHSRQSQHRFMWHSALTGLVLKSTFFSVTNFFCFFFSALSHFFPNSLSLVRISTERGCAREGEDSWCWHISLELKQFIPEFGDPATTYNIFKALTHSSSSFFRKIKHPVGFFIFQVVLLDCALILALWIPACLRINNQIGREVIKTNVTSEAPSSFMTLARPQKNTKRTAAPVSESMMSLCAAGTKSFYQILQSWTGTWPAAPGPTVSEYKAPKTQVLVFVRNIQVKATGGI